MTSCFNIEINLSVNKFVERQCTYARYTSSHTSILYSGYGSPIKISERIKNKETGKVRYIYWNNWIKPILIQPWLF